MGRWLNSLYKLAENALELDEDVLVKFYVIGHEKEVLDLNRLDQLYIQGENADGRIIGVYSAVTEYLTQGQSYTYEGVTTRKLEGHKMTLFDSGDFFKTFDIKYENDGFRILADDTKDDTHLLNRYPKIIGLSDESKVKLIEMLKPYLLASIRKILRK
jgi:hypothetical protein